MLTDLLTVVKKYTIYPVQDHPVKSTSIAFGAGVLAGKYDGVVKWVLGLFF